MYQKSTNEKLPVDAVSVVAHACDAPIVREITSNGPLKGLNVASSKGNTTSVASSEGLNDVLHIHLDTIDAA